MPHNIIHTNEFYCEDKMLTTIMEELKIFVGKQIEFTVQGNEYTILAQFTSKLIDIETHKSFIESGHLETTDFFIYLINELNVKFSIPTHQVIMINRFANNNIEFDCQLYKLKIRHLTNHIPKNTIDSIKKV